eukprot:scaffold586_cov112-Skeletonema_dohrnii-CCMP3373.AAC.5
MSFLSPNCHHTRLKWKTRKGSRRLEEEDEAGRGSGVYSYTASPTTKSDTDYVEVWWAISNLSVNLFIQTSPCNLDSEDFLSFNSYAAWMWSRKFFISSTDSSTEASLPILLPLIPRILLSALIASDPAQPTSLGVWLIVA